MASPQVANLAAKVLAVNPDLEPAEVFELIVRGSETLPGDDQGLKVIHPQQTIQLVWEGDRPH